MSISSIQQGHEGNRSPALSINLSSNNPFRNRAASPAMSSSTQRSPREAPPRPVSRNPFLDTSQPTSSSIDRMAAPNTNTSLNSPGSGLTGHAAELFDELTLMDKPVPEIQPVPEKRPVPEIQPVPRRQPGPGRQPVPDRRQKPFPPPVRSNSERNQPPSAYSENMRPGSQRPARSPEEAMRRKLAYKQSSSRRELDIFADEKGGLPRRNSDGSINPEEERREALRRREREKRHRDRAQRQRAKNSADLIDKMDETSIDGLTRIHHDGPYDACLTIRNKKGIKQAPINAFAKESQNMTLGGSGPIDLKPNHALLFGNSNFDDDYGTEVRPTAPVGAQPNVESAYTRVEPVHGPESIGLGTSTFLEGAPASRTAIQQNQTAALESGGLSRKKSLAQKIRGIPMRRDYGSSATRSPNAVDSPGYYTPGGSKGNEQNPFFNEFTKGDDTIQEESFDNPEPPRSDRSRAPSSPPGIERRVTSDGNQVSGGGGFLSRVKSLKGGPRRPKVENKPLPTPQLT